MAESSRNGEFVKSTYTLLFTYIEEQRSIRENSFLSPVKFVRIKFETCFGNGVSYSIGQNNLTDHDRIENVAWLKTRGRRKTCLLLLEAQQ